MSDEFAGRYAGVADQDLAAPAAVLRGPGGKLLPGARLNPRGRPSGRPNDSTLAANDLLRSHARRAAEVMAQALGDPNVWVRFGAAKTILERVLPNDGSEPPDVGWMDFLTERESSTLARMLKRAKKREERGEVMPRGQHVLPPGGVDVDPPADELVIDVAATVESAGPEPEPAMPEPEVPE